MNNDIKSTLRKQILTSRKIMPIMAWEKRSEKINEKVLGFIHNHQFSVIHSFLPIERNREVNTWPIIHHLAAKNFQVIISTTDFEKEEMHHFIFTEKLEFKLNPFDIPEPVSAQPAEIERVEIILIPLLAADKKGNRIGYGKGYYDRLLAFMPGNVKKVGLSLGNLFDEFTFSETHDIRLDYCITPFELIECK